jgi:hypothetical protein
LKHNWALKQILGVPFCIICGIVKRKYGQNKPCKGPTKMRKMETPIDKR